MFSFSASKPPWRLADTGFEFRLPVPSVSLSRSAQIQSQFHKPAATEPPCRLRAFTTCGAAGRTPTLVMRGAGKHRWAPPNPSLKRSANGRPPGPVWQYAVHFRQPGPGVLPLSPA